MPAMKALYDRKFFLSPAMAILLIGCSVAPLQKSKDLLTAELFLQKTSKDIKVLQFAELELIKAGNALEAAAQAETEEQMASLVYVGNNQINTAIKTAEIMIAKKTIRDANTLRANRLRLKIIEKRTKSK